MLSCYELCATNTQQQQQQQRRDKPRFERTEASRSVRAIPNCNGSEEVCVCMIRDHARSQRACDTDKREGERCGRPSKQARARCSREGGVWCVCGPLWRERGGCRSWSLVVVWSRLRASLLFSSLHAPPRIHRRSLSQGYVRVRARDTMDRPLAIDRSTDENTPLPSPSPLLDQSINRARSNDMDSNASRRICTTLRHIAHDAIDDARSTSSSSCSATTTVEPSTCAAEKVLSLLLPCVRALVMEAMLTD